MVREELEKPLFFWHECAKPAEHVVSTAAIAVPYRAPVCRG
jgi:hypothetical protein